MWKVETKTLPEGIHTLDQVKRYVGGRTTFIMRNFAGKNITVSGNTISHLGNQLLGDKTSDGFGDIFLVKVGKEFLGPTAFNKRRGPKDVWSMLKTPSKYLSNGTWNRNLPEEMREKLNRLLMHINLNSEFQDDVRRTGGSFGSGNKYSSSSDGPFQHVPVVPVDNEVTIEDYIAYGMPENPYKNNPSQYHRQPFYSFIQNAPITKDFDEEMIAILIEGYEYLCTYSNHNNTDAYKLGQYLKLLHQGGFKYTIHRKYEGGIYVTEELDHCVMKIGAPPYNNPGQKPINTGGAIHLPICLTGRENYTEVSIKGIRDLGVHFQLFSALKPRQLYILSRMERGQLKHYWTYPAPYGAFIYRPKDGRDCLNYGCAVVPFGVSVAEQLGPSAVRREKLLSRCVCCFTDNCATQGFTCEGHEHFFLCDKSECLATKYNFATGSLRPDGARKFQCPICRAEHDRFDS